MHVIVTPHLSVVSTNTYPTVTMAMGYIAVYHVSVVVCGADTQSDEVPDAPRHRGEQQRPSSARMTPRTKVSLDVWWCVCVCMHVCGGMCGMCGWVYSYPCLPTSVPCCRRISWLPTFAVLVSIKCPVLLQWSTLSPSRTGRKRSLPSISEE